MSYPAIGEVLYAFDKSDEKKSLIDYPDQRIRKTITDFAFTLAHVGCEDLKLWTEKYIEYFLKETISYEENFENPNAKIHAFNAYQILAAFLRFAAKKEYLSLSTAKIDDLLRDIEGDSYLAESIVPFTPEENGKKLTNYQEKTSQKYLKFSDEWCTKCLASSDFVSVYGDLDDLMIKMLMGTLTVDIYQIYRKTPKTWTKKALTEVMTYDFVKETTFTDHDVTSIIPALTNLMRFLGKTDLLDQNKTEKYIRFFEEIQPEMLKQIHNDVNTNLYKLIREETVKRQLDLADQERVHKFGETFFAEGGFEGLKKHLEKDDHKSEDRAIDDFLSRNSYATNDDEVVDESELLNDPEQLRKAAKNCETDAERQYLNNDHVLKYGNHLWNIEEARQYHDLGLELGLKLYLKRRQYGMDEDISKSDVVDTIVQTVDFFYANYLTGPAEWQTRNMLEVGGSLRSHTSDEGMSILKNLIRMMRNDDITTFEHADALIDALLGRSSSVGSVGFSKGKLKLKKKKRK